MEQWQTWLPELAARLSQHRLLDRRQRLAVWTDVIRESPDEINTLNTAAIAAWADDAWQTLRMHAVDALHGGDATPELVRLRQWGHSYARRLAAGGWSDRPTVLEQLGTDSVRRALARRPRELILLGIPHVTTVESDCLESLRAAGWRVTRTDAPKLASQVSVRPFDSAAAEIEAALGWLRQRLERQPNARVALVAAHDGVLEAMVGRRSHSLPSVTFARASRPRDLPGVAAALNALEMLGTDGRMRHLSAWLRSPFMQTDDPSGFGAAARFELARRELPIAQLPLSITWPLLLEQLEASAADAALRMRPALALRAPSDTVASLTQWTERWRSQLSALQWMRAREARDAEQAVRVIERAFDAVAALGSIIGAVTGARAMQELQTVLDERLVGSPLPLSGLHILEHIDDVGPGYAAVWVTGMSRSNWPPRVRANPLLPRRLLQSLRIPWATREDCLQRAEIGIRRTAAMAESVCFSYSPPENDDRARPAAALMPWLQDEGAPANPGTVLNTTGAAPDTNREADGRSEGSVFTGNSATRSGVTGSDIADTQAVADETVIDTATRLPPGLLSGGAALLDKQAVCPLRAFIDHRLHVRAPRPLVRGIAPTLRGQILHRAAALLLPAGTTREAIAAIAREDIDGRIVNAAAAAVSRELREARPWFGALAELEQERVSTILRQLLEIDAGREPFVVDSVERPVRYDVDDYSLSVRIDRIDRLDGGELAIIDYKTGRNTARPHWFSEDIADYQMPLYALSLERRVGAIALCTLGAERIDYRGYWQQRGMFPGKPEKLPQSSTWQQLLEQWRVEIDELVLAFVAADFAMDTAADKLLDGMYAPLTRVAETHKAERAAGSAEGQRA